ncbi:MAG: hypothetical protein QF704_01930 [Anaerolineales bacterium]|jgi:hypothetical protein|nr:hypothetical protein [Anaerolineales bacterium]
MKTRRRRSREIPPERKAMGDPCIPSVFGMPGYGRGRNISVVFPN